MSSHGDESAGLAAMDPPLSAETHWESGTLVVGLTGEWAMERSVRLPAGP